MSGQISVFLAHPKGESNESIAAMKERALRVLQQEWAQCEVTITGGVEDYDQNAKYLAMTQMGRDPWDVWTEHVSKGANPVTGAPRYHVCVATTQRVGRATAMIVDGFLRMRKPVYLLGVHEGKTAFTPVFNVTQVSKSMQNGWELQLSTNETEVR